MFNIFMGKCVKNACSDVKDIWWMKIHVLLHVDNAIVLVDNKITCENSVECNEEYGFENKYIKDQHSCFWQGRWNDRLSINNEQLEWVDACVYLDKLFINREKSMDRL